MHLLRRGLTRVLPSKGLVRSDVELAAARYSQNGCRARPHGAALTAPSDEVIEQDIEFVTRVPLSREPICLLLTAERFGGVLGMLRSLEKAWPKDDRNCLDAAMHSPLPQRVNFCRAISRRARRVRRHKRTPIGAGRPLN